MKKWSWFSKFGPNQELVKSSFPVTTSFPIENWKRKLKSVWVNCLTRLRSRRTKLRLRSFILRRDFGIRGSRVKSSKCPITKTFRLSFGSWRMKKGRSEKYRLRGMTTFPARNFLRRWKRLHGVSGVFGPSVRVTGRRFWKKT